MTNELTKPELNIAGGMVQLTSIENAYRFAQYVASSGLAPSSFKTPESVLVAVQMGAEVGLKPMQSLQNIAVINGRAALWGKGMLGVVKSSGLLTLHEEWFEGEGDTLVARCKIKRKGDSQEHIGQFSMADAKRASLLGKSTWQQYPKDMCMWKARARAFGPVFSDILVGLPIAEDIRDIPNDAPAEEVLGEKIDDPLLKTVTATILSESAPMSQTTATGTAEPNVSAALPTPDISNRQHLENLQKQSDARLDAKMEAKREAVATENAGEVKASATETLEEKKKRLDAKKRKKTVSVESAEVETPRSEGATQPKEYACKACQDTKKNSKGGDCPICNQKKLPSIQEAATVDTVPLSTGEPSTLTKLEALYSGTSGLSVDDLRERGRSAWRLLSDDQRATVLRGMLTDSDHFVDDAKKWGPPQWRSFLGECVSSVKD